MQSKRQALDIFKKLGDGSGISAICFKDRWAEGNTNHSKKKPLKEEIFADNKL